MVRLRDLASSALPPRRAAPRESGRLHDPRYMICGMLCQAPEVRTLCVHGVTRPLRDKAVIGSVAGRLARDPRSLSGDRAD
jgi:hypothetical protein